LMREQSEAMQAKLHEQYQHQISQQAQFYERILDKFTSVQSTAAQAAPTEAKPGESKLSVKDLIKAGAAASGSEAWSAAMQAKMEAKASADQLKEIRSAAADFKERLHKLMNVEEKLDVIKEKQTKLNEGGQPSGIKPYAAPWEFAAMDEDAALAGKSITIPVPEGTTRAELRKLIWNKYHSLTAMIDIEILESRKVELQENSSLDSFIAAVSAKVHKAELGIEKYTELVKAPPGLVKPASDDPYFHEAAKCYAGLVRAKAEERRKRDIEKDKERAKLAKAKEEAEKMTPDQVVEAKFKALLKDTKLGGKQKNGLSPGGAQGQNPNQAKGKGKGKGKKPKGKGKGKEKGKGKGKGKSKESKGSDVPFWKKGWKGNGKGKAQ
jgi:hypothetical protein